MQEFRKYEIELDEKSPLYDKDLTKEVQTLSNYIDKLNQCFRKEQDNFAEICYYVYHIKELFRDYTRTYYCGFETRKRECCTFDSIMRGFGLDDTQVSRICKCYEKFVYLPAEDTIYIKAGFAEFGKSKLFELLPVPTETLEKDIKLKVIRPDMSVKSIRDYVKNYHALQKQNKKLTEPQEKIKEPNIDDEIIPEAYNPTKHYDFNYFEDKTKAQLLNIIWQLQTEYEKLKGKRK